MKKYFFIFTTLFTALILILSIRGLVGNPSQADLLSLKWRDNGPFELSPERGRFALTYSLVETHSVFFPVDVARFVIPDLGYHDGHYVSLFAPLLAFIVVPGYVIGKFFGAAQVGTFTIISLFALLNFSLLRSIAIRLGANSIPATIGALVFIFGTPAFSYAVNLYQHHISTFLILLSIYALLKSNKAWALLIVFFLCAAAIPLDYPNLFFMFPLGVFALGRIISLEKIRKRVSVKINLIKILSPLIMIVPILFFLWFNSTSYGGPTHMLGSSAITSVKGINAQGKPTTPKVTRSVEEIKNSSPTEQINRAAYFQARSLLNGFYIHFVSSDRGVIYYAPVVLFGIIGFILALRKKVKMVPLLASIVGANILLYSMWGDPWGGWAFGSRYLIPSYAILSIFVALLLTYWRKKIWFLVPFIWVAFYSIAVNTLGAITTSAMPPQTEVLALEKVSGIVQRYTYQRNWEFLLSGNSKSFVYQTFLRSYLTPLQFYQILTVSIFLVVGGILVYYVLTANREGKVNV